MCRSSKIVVLVVVLVLVLDEARASITDVTNRGVFAKIKVVGDSKMPGENKRLEDEDDDEHENDFGGATTRPPSSWILAPNSLLLFTRPGPGRPP